MISQTFLPGISTFSGSIDHVINLIFVLAVGWFIVLQGLVIYFAVRYRRRPGVKASFITGESWGQLAWVLVPVALALVCDLGIDAAGGDTWETVKGDLPPPAVTVHVMAQQFSWKFTYPGEDGKFGTGHDLVEDALHVPAGQVVHVVLESKDVIHDFFVPALRLKQDILPGRAITAWFNASEPGTYEIACSQLCGPAHFGMRGKVVVDTPNDFNTWLTAERAAQAKKAAADTSATRGNG